MQNKNLTILGGGPAGLALGYYAKQEKYNFTIYEGQNRIGGNCKTFSYGDFLFDSGAHRIHGTSKEIATLLQTLMQDELKQIHSPSQIYKNGQFIDFPLTPLNLMRKMGAKAFLKATVDIFKENLTAPKTHKSFQDIALKAYGKHIAENFLLNYSEKLWGVPCYQLSPKIAGQRLKGLNLSTFIIEGLLGLKAKTQHIDGAFFYPDYGIGSIFERLATACGREHILLNHTITKIHHRNQRIQHIELNGEREVPVEYLLNTLPLNVFLRILHPAPPAALFELVQQIRFRNIVLLVFMIDKPSINKNASMYFPDSKYPFTRIYEPKNRSAKMAPPHQTTLAVEIPCQKSDIWWTLDKSTLVHTIKKSVLELGFFREEELLETVVHRLPFAYPILELGFEKKVQEILAYLKRFENLYTSGRNGVFQYSHIHDMFLTGKNIIKSL